MSGVAGITRFFESKRYSIYLPHPLKRRRHRLLWLAAAQAPGLCRTRVPSGAAALCRARPASPVYFWSKPSFLRSVQQMVRTRAQLGATQCRNTPTLATAPPMVASHAPTVTAIIVPPFHSSFRRRCRSSSPPAAAHAAADASTVQSQALGGNRTDLLEAAATHAHTPTLATTPPMVASQAPTDTAIIELPFHSSFRRRCRSSSPPAAAHAAADASTVQATKVQPRLRGQRAGGRPAAGRKSDRVKALLKMQAIPPPHPNCFAIRRAQEEAGNARYMGLMRYLRLCN